MGSELKTLKALASVVSVWILHVVCIPKNTRRHFFILIHVPCIFYYIVLWPTNAQLFHKLPHSNASTLSCHPQGACNQYLAMLHKHKTYVKHLNWKLYYQQLHLKYMCNLARYWLQAPRGWHDSVETCRVIICEIIVLLLVIVHSDEQKSIGLKFSKSQTGSHVTYSCHHNLNRFAFPIFVHSWRFSVFHSLQSITPRTY